jgi:hypothetical protein
MEARARLGELPIGVSIIALGEENPALRALAAKQRARGERVFYHYLSDAELERLIAGQALGPPIHAPAGREDIPAALSELVDEIEAYTRSRDDLGATHADDLQAALDELGLSLEKDFTEGERALYEVRARDERTLIRRFERWFPAPIAALDGEKGLFEPPSTDVGDLTNVECLLASVTEVVELVGGDDLERRASAIDVFERVLLDAGVTPWRYAELCRRYPQRLEASLTALRTVVCG